MDAIQRVNLKNFIKSIKDENIHNFFIDKDNIVSMEARTDEFSVYINDTYLIFQTGELIEYIVDTIDKYIINEQIINKNVLFADMRNLTKEERDILYESLKDMSVDTGIQLFPEVKIYDYKKNLEHLKERYENKIRYINSHYSDSENTEEDKLVDDGLIEGLQTAISDIDNMLNGLEV